MTESVVVEILAVQQQYSQLHTSLHVARHERLIGEVYKVKTPSDRPALCSAQRTA